MSGETSALMDDGRSRALMTEREREILLGDADVSEKYYHVVVTRVRKRINQLADEIPALEAHDTLADELREVVCCRESNQGETG